MSVYQEFKKQVLEHCQALARKGYLVGSGGNLSMRVEGEEGLGTFWVSIQDGTFSAGEGAIDSPDLALTISAQDAA